MRAFLLALCLCSCGVDDSDSRRLAAYWQAVAWEQVEADDYAQALQSFSRCREAASACGQESRYRDAWLSPTRVLTRVEGHAQTAWRLLWEYRRIHGNDHSFCVEFGSFARELGAYNVAEQFLRAAIALQPDYLPAYVGLVEVAARMEGPLDIARQRIQRAQDMLACARRAIDYGRRTGSDRQADCSSATAEIAHDPLVGCSANRPPEWVLTADQTRD